MEEDQYMKNGMFSNQLTLGVTVIEPKKEAKGSGAPSKSIAAGDDDERLGPRRCGGAMLRQTISRLPWRTCSPEPFERLRMGREMRIVGTRSALRMQFQSIDRCGGLGLSYD